MKSQVLHILCDVIFLVKLQGIFEIVSQRFLRKMTNSKQFSSLVFSFVSLGK